MSSITKRQNTFQRVFGGDTPLERARLIAELDGEPPDPFVTMRLTDAQTRTLAQYLRLLPDPDFRLLALHYHCRWPPERIARFTGEPRVRGRMAYCKDRLTQCMGLPRPISEWYWRVTFSYALDTYDFQANAN